jgi:hypothetical protein
MTEIDLIQAVGITKDGALWVKPATASFPLIYREAMEVHWDEREQRLFGAKPRQHPDLDFSQLQWFRQILAAAQEQGVQLVIGEKTDWSNTPPELRNEISAL